MLPPPSACCRLTATLPVSSCTAPLAHCLLLPVSSCLQQDGGLGRGGGGAQCRTRRRLGVQGLPAASAERYAYLTHNLMGAAPRQYQDALHPATQRAIAALLLRRCLPVLTAAVTRGGGASSSGRSSSGGGSCGGSSWELGRLEPFFVTLCDLCCTLSNLSLAQAVAFWVSGPCGPALVQHAVQAALAVPAVVPPSTPTDLLQTTQLAVSSLLADLCTYSTPGSSGSSGAVAREWEETAWSALLARSWRASLLGSSAK